MTTWSRFYSVRDRVQRHVNGNLQEPEPLTTSLTIFRLPVARGLRLSIPVCPALCVTLQCFSYTVV